MVESKLKYKKFEFKIDIIRSKFVAIRFTFLRTNCVDERFVNDEEREDLNYVHLSLAIESRQLV